MVVLEVLIIVLSIMLVQFIWKQQKFNEVDKLLPGPKGLPLFGIGLDFIGVSNAEILQIMKRLILKYPSPFKFWLGPKLFVITDNPQDAQIILNSPNSSNKAAVYKFMESTFNVGIGGLISLNGDVWKHHRKLLNGCFKPDILKTYVSIFNKCARNMTNNVSKHAGQKKTFNIEKNIHACSLDMIVETSLGTELNCQFDDDVEFMVACDGFLRVLTTRLFNIWMHPEFIFQRSKFHPIFAEACKVMLSFCEEVLAKISLEYTRNKNVVKEGVPKTFINQLFNITQSGQAFNNAEVLAETITVVLAGNETSANAMSNTILLLAMHPNIQDKVVAELKQVLFSQDSDITMEQLNQLVYLKQVINEAMRLLVVVPLYSRVLTGEVVLSDGVTLPKGSNVVIPVMTLHRRKDIWGEDADVFNPEHFAPEFKRHSYSFLPFSGGPRICIGYQYAYMSMAITIADLIRHYKLSTELTLDMLEWDFCITLQLINKHLVSIEKRVW